MHTGQLEQCRADAPGSIPPPRTDGESGDEYSNFLTRELDPLHCPPEFPAGWIPFAHHGVQLINFLAYSVLLPHAPPGISWDHLPDK